MATLIKFLSQLTSNFEYGILPKRYKYSAFILADFKRSSAAEFEQVTSAGLAIFKNLLISIQLSHPINFSFKGAFG